MIDPPLVIFHKVVICKLNKSIYGLRQPSQRWFHKFSSTLLSQGFIQSKPNCSLFIRTQGTSFVTLLIYVDEAILASNDAIALSTLKSFLND